VRAYRADRVFDGERVLPGVDVVVEGPRVTAVGTAPAGTPVVELPGCTLLPGLIDAHVHLVGDGGPDALARVPGRTDLGAVVTAALGRHLTAGVTTVRDLGDHHWAVADRGSGDGEPRVVASGPPITTPGGHCWSMGGEAAGTAALTRAVAERAERGVDVVKLIVSGGSMTAGSDLLALQYGPDDVAHVVRTAHAAGLPVTAHAHSVESVRVCLDAGVDGIEHCTCMTAAGLETPVDLFAALASAGTWVCPTIGRTPGSRPSPQAEALAARTGWSVAGRLAQVGVQAAAGVRLVSGSDAGIHPGKPHGVLPYAVAELVTAGLDPVRALTTATADAAVACGLVGVTGRVRPGLSADLLVVRGDPTTRIEDLVRVERVIVRGTPTPIGGNDNRSR
jgi:imidazolonepropionase-like amidohydrolase